MFSICFKIFKIHRYRNKVNVSNRGNVTLAVAENVMNSTVIGKLIMEPVFVDFPWRIRQFSMSSRSSSDLKKALLGSGWTESAYMEVRFRDVKMFFFQVNILSETFPHIIRSDRVFLCFWITHNTISFSRKTSSNRWCYKLWFSRKRKMFNGRQSWRNHSRASFRLLEFPHEVVLIYKVGEVSTASFAIKRTTDILNNDVVKLQV